MESMPEGGFLLLAIQHGQGFVRLCVADTGAGINQEDLGKSLMRFLRQNCWVRAWG